MERISREPKSSICCESLSSTVFFVELHLFFKNAQGDIIGLFDKTGTQVVSYSYDTWGKLISIGGSLASTVGAENPYRYRGYRYDSETGLYYLQSRYYNPEWGRLINADDAAGKVGELLSHNVFAYCLNNPVNMYDPSGHWSIWATIAVVAVVVAVVAIAVVAPEALVAVAEFALEDGAAEVAAEEVASDVAVGAAEDVGEGIAEETAARTISAEISSKESAEVEEATCESEGNCFVAGTLVDTQSGQKTIENIQVGDVVYSENSETGEKEYKKVKQTFVHEVDTLVEVSIGNTKLDTTEGHKFWVVGKGWVEAKDLKEGEKVLEASGKEVTITSVKVEKLKHKVKVYNFEVEDFHTYFVSDLDILVHNTCGQKGGAYKDVTKNGGENHHMPADLVSPFTKGKGPTINMSVEDHRLTASWGNSRDAQVFRSNQAELISQGMFKEAQQMDIDDVRNLFGDKYDEGINQMLEYTVTLFEE
jgi:RHS repeat-associated protein